MKCDTGSVKKKEGGQGRLEQPTAERQHSRTSIEQRGDEQMRRVLLPISLRRIFLFISTVTHSPLQSA
jgi:hypothetical protein